MKKNLLVWMIAFLTCSQAFSQFKSNINDTIVNGKLISLSYSLQLPAGDLADRFGINNNIGAGLYFKISHNFLIGAEGNYIFSGNIREDSILDHLFTASGGLIGIDGLFETVFLFERGFAFWGKFGKIIPAFHSGPNSGITLIAGAGFLQHRLKISDPNQTLPYVSDEYEKGYDRLTNGAAVSQYIGYTHLDKHRLVNFTAGIELYEGFTKNRRDFNFDQMRKDDANRFDMLIGLKASFILPFYGKTEERIYTF